MSGEVGLLDCELREQTDQTPPAWLSPPRLSSRFSLRLSPLRRLCPWLASWLRTPLSAVFHIVIVTTWLVQSGFEPGLPADQVSRQSGYTRPFPEAI